VAETKTKAEAESTKLMTDARNNAKQILTEAEHHARELVEKAEAEAGEKWVSIVNQANEIANRTLDMAGVKDQAKPKSKQSPGKRPNT
jgi:vacuolar-type H+-ATPase subunit H